jgi:hypothetical protein
MYIFSRHHTTLTLICFPFSVFCFLGHPNVQVVNVDKERMQYAWRLSGAGHSLSLSCTLRGNTGVQVRSERSRRVISYQCATRLRRGKMSKFALYEKWTFSDLFFAPNFSRMGYFSFSLSLPA